MKKNGLYKGLKLLVFIILFVHVICPLAMLLGNIKAADIKAVFTSNQFLPMLWNSVLSTTLATVISVLLALALAWCLNRSGLPHKNGFSLWFTIPMLIPSISHGMGLTILFGDNGIFTNLTGINIHLYGLIGIVIGETLYAFPAAFLMFANIFQYEDFTTYEVSKVLGLTKRQQFTQITLPNLKKPLISAIFATFTMIFTDYGVPLVVGGKMTTLPVYMYREVIGLLDYSKGAVLGLVLLVPAIVAFFVDLFNKEENSSSTVTKPYVIEENRKRDIICATFLIVVLILILIPVITFLVLCFVNQYPIDFSITFKNIRESLDMGLWRYLKNSLFIALTTALIGTMVTYVTAYFTARHQGHFSSMVLHLISIITLSIPGIVLGLSYVMFFKGSIVYGTFIILISINMIHFFASPYLLAYNALLKFNEHLEDVAETLGLSKLQMLKDVYFPSTYDTVLEMYGYIFVNCMVTISAVSFLANFKNMPIALLIPQFESQSLIGAISFISIAILFVNLICKVVIYRLKKHFMRKEAAL